MKVYVLVITDIEIDAEPIVFLRKEDAIDYAENKIRSFALEYKYNDYLRDKALEDFEYQEKAKLGSLDIALYEREINE